MQTAPLSGFGISLFLGTTGALHGILLRQMQATLSSAIWKICSTELTREVAGEAFRLCPLPNSRTVMPLCLWFIVQKPQRLGHPPDTCQWLVSRA